MICHPNEVFLASSWSHANLRWVNICWYLHIIDVFGIIVGRSLTSSWLKINFSSQVYFTVGSLTCFAKCSCGWKWMFCFFIWSLWHQEWRLNHSLHWWVAEHNGSPKADRVVFCSSHVFSGVIGEGYKTCDSLLDCGFGIFKSTSGVCGGCSLLVLKLRCLIVHWKAWQCQHRECACFNCLLQSS